MNGTGEVSSLLVYSPVNGTGEVSSPLVYSPVNGTGEVSSPLVYSPVNSSLHNLPVNRIFVDEHILRKFVLMYNMIPQ